ncbi:MAG: Lipid-A-disaccharide synthase [Opitutia bacterium UBA7350]|nr:MAG: Lipid-A-disaccharide synthase [Opitutae bacterium UBA7350]
MNSKRQNPAAFDTPLGSGVDLLLISGEHSGDEHAAEMLKELKAKNPELRIACLGGPKLAAAGAQLLYDLTSVSVVGFLEVIKHYSFFKALFDCTIDWIETIQPKHICFVDYPGFNLRLAKELRKRGLSQKGGGVIRLHYYIGPQVWAWKAKRRFQMAQTIDRLGVIFPFEVECFKDTNLPVEYTVHPFARERYQLPFYQDPSGSILLLPGSRVEACRRIFPLLLEGFSQAYESHSNLRACVIYPSEQIRKVLERVLQTYPEIKDVVKLQPKSIEPVGARAALMSSGTISLSVALSGIPGAIAYKMNTWSYFLSRCLVKIPYIGISNLLLNRPLHPEFIQNEATAKNLSAALLEACEQAGASAAKEGSDELKEILNRKHAAKPGAWLMHGLD